jgi:DNA-binding GntR family transcriptional regulator
MLPVTASMHTPLSEQAFAQLRKAVLAGAFEPGAKLKIDELQGSYGFSSSPLREALNRLSQEGLVRADDRKGFRVAPISREDLADITHMRLMLDVAALRESIQHGDDAWEAAIVAAAHRLAKVELQLGEGPKVLNETWTGLHRDYHSALLAACPSQRQRVLCASLFDQAERYRRYSALHRVSHHNKNKAHRSLMDAVLKRDVDTACVLLAEHIRSTQTNVEAALLRLEASHS